MGNEWIEDALTSLEDVVDAVYAGLTEDWHWFPENAPFIQKTATKDQHRELYCEVRRHVVRLLSKSPTREEDSQLATPTNR